MKKIIIVTYGGGHVNMLLPVIKCLLKKPEIDLCILALTTAGKVLQREGIQYIGFQDLLTDANRKAIKIGRELVGPVDLDSPVEYDESVAYMGLSYCDLQLRLGNITAKELFEKGGRQSFYQLSIMVRFLSDERPDLVIATNSPRCEKAALDAAGKLNIPAMCLVDLFALQESEWIRNNAYASRVCVLSEYVKTMLISKGRSAEDIVVTGNPAFDSLAVIDQRTERGKLRREMGWGEKDRVLLWASSVEPENHPFTNIKGDVSLPEKVCNELMSIVEVSENYKLVIRPHPSEQASHDVSGSHVFISTQKQPIEELLVAVDGVIVFASTVGLQAALLNKPLINIRLSVFSKDAPYDEMGLSIPVYELEELRWAIDAMFTKRKDASELPLVGHATQKVIKEIMNMLCL